MRPRKRSIGHDVSDVDFQVTRGITQNRIHLLCAFECAWRAPLSAVLLQLLNFGG